MSDSTTEEGTTTKLPNLDTQMGIEPDETYFKHDGTSITGLELSALMAKRSSTPYAHYFCPLCCHELVLLGSGFKCTNCGSPIAEV